MTEINGAEIEAVDVITFGSPCQDLSVAGKRAGLKHSANGDDETTRSGLFMEAVRIIKEMRRATHGEYPKFVCWENVPGAFSSNKGEDFRTVLQELVQIVEPEAPPIPAPGKAGWPYADCIVGDRWSLAWRVFDAQYWPGTPQRRRRIYLVLDLTGDRAEKVLFERPGLRGHSEESGAPKEGASEDPPNRSGADDPKSGLTAYGISSYDGNSMKSSNPHSGIYTATTSRTIDLNGGNPACKQGGIAIVEPVAFAQNQRDEVRDLGDKAGALQAEPGMKQQTFILDSIGGQAERGWECDTAPCLKATHYKSPPCVTVAAGFSTEHSAKARSVGYQEEISPTLRAGTVPAAVYDARGNGDGKIANTITGDHNGHISDYTALACYCIDGDKIGKGERAGGSGLGIRDGDKMYTLTAKDAGTHSVCYTDTYQRVTGPLMANEHAGLPGQDAFSDMLVTERAYCMAHGQANAEICENISPTLSCNHEQPIIFDKEVYNSGANAAGGHYIAEGGPSPTLRGTGHAPGVCDQYIVRRLTPTECARLQGFPDRWGDIPLKDTLTDEEYSFWLTVRNTHAAINGRTTKEYTKDQILKWYNKLRSDSAEYKMWGNGIALPNALYVMQGIAEAVNT